ncbi:tripartite motif-containing protein 59 [Oryzias latipes]|uniref:Tripartite motif containing 59 n=1 Tax=Oryzias latipes TaxID=8090 RepID=A0A3B3HVF4_ORYLA|nr:tripartite motif-containing protein 59 [Oryzias latipes]XP_023817832.1 tripartite motif-containing protein 59 [Oryzias latipes]
MDSLEEDLTCSVCYQLFSDPRVLPCSHTFCQPCLENLLQVSTNYSIWRPLRLPIKCPNCRSVVELPPAGVDALPSNVSLRAIIEKYQRDEEPRPPSCQEHPRQPLNMYCIQDRQLICGLCLTVGQHHGHPIDDLQAAFAREKATPQQLAELSEHRWAEVCELGEQLEQEKTRCEGLLRQDRDDVTQFFHSLALVMAKKKEAYLEVLDKAAAEVSQAYDPLIQRVKELQEEQLELMSLGSSVEEEEESPLAFLEKVHLFRERVDKFLKAPLPHAIKLSVTPRAADYLQQHWPPLTIGALEEAPVPAVCCCTRRGSAEAAAADGSAAAARVSWPDQLLAVSAFLVTLLLTAVWLNPLGRAGWPHFGQLVHSQTGDFLASVEEGVMWAWTTTGVTLHGWSSQLSLLRDQVFQVMAAFFETPSS